MGVWIEIMTNGCHIWNPPVTPLVGVWIEICNHPHTALTRTVTPLVGVWIEIGDYIDIMADGESLPLWECGLKWTG